LIKNAEALERFEKIDTLVVDKTGTLTEGKPALTDILPADGFNRDEVLRHAAALQQFSDHPLAHAVMTAVTGLDIPPASGAAALPGRGVRGEADGTGWMLGSTRLLDEHGRAPEPLLAEARRLEGDGRSLSWLLREEPEGVTVAGLLTFGDTLKPESRPAVARLQALAPGIELASVRIDRRDVESELAAGTLDLALDVPLAMGESIRQQRISRDRLVVVARQDHPGIGGELDLDTYLAHAHVLVSSRRKGWGLEDFELNREGRRRRIVLRCQHYFAASRVASRTDLLLTMPEQYARIANMQFGNRIYPFPLQTQALDAHLYWHATADHDPANRWLRGVMQEVVSAWPDGAQ